LDPSKEEENKKKYNLGYKELIKASKYKTKWQPSNEVEWNSCLVHRKKVAKSFYTADTARVFKN
jgi:hypothetical protein